MSPLFYIRTQVIYSYVFPALEERLQYTAHIANALITCSLRYGRVDTTMEVAGVACWLSPGQTEMNLWRSLRTGFTLQRAIISFPKEARERMLGTDAGHGWLHG